MDGILFIFYLYKMEYVIQMCFFLKKKTHICYKHTPIYIWNMFIFYLFVCIWLQQNITAFCDWKLNSLSRYVVLCVIRMSVILFLCSTLTVRALTAFRQNTMNKKKKINSEVCHHEVDNFIKTSRSLNLDNSHNVSTSLFYKILHHNS